MSHVQVQARRDLRPGLRLRHGPLAAGQQGHQEAGEEVNPCGASVFRPPRNLPD